MEIFQAVYTPSTVMPTLGSLTNFGEIIWIDKISPKVPDPLIQIKGISGIKYRLSEVNSIDVFLYLNEKKEYETDLKLAKHIFENNLEELEKFKDFDVKLEKAILVPKPIKLIDKAYSKYKKSNKIPNCEAFVEYLKENYTLIERQ